MPELIAWCGFVGAWLLVIGPLGQAARELEEEEFDRSSVVLAGRRVERPDPVSPWWWLIPPVYYVLRQRHDRAYQARIAAAMKPEDLEAFVHLRDVASTWMYVAGGASLIAIKETWELHEQYEWGDWIFWMLVLVMLLLCAARIVVRVRRGRAPVGR